MRTAAVVLAIVLTLICLWWTIDYVLRRASRRRR
jgi:preprotein translocase subunit SecE